jgi:tripartite-type tricarboxylate transporter receptor subunit TctC
MMGGIGRTSYGVLLLAATSWIVAPQSFAQSVSDFYRGRTVEFVVGYLPGAGFDSFGRLLAQHMGKYIPGGPKVVVKNMPGAANLNAMKYMYATAARDGSTIGIVNPNLFNLAVLEPQTVNMDFNRFTWLGNMSKDTKVCFTWKQTGVVRLDDLKTMKVHLAGTTKGAGYIYGSILHSIYPSTVQIVLGYLSNADIWLALERGEAEAFCSGWGAIPSRKSEWIAGDKISVLLQFAKEPDLRLPNVPTIFELNVSDDMKKAIGFLIRADAITRPVFAPPGIPADRAAVLRTAFMATMRDSDFLEAAKRADMDIDPSDADETARIVDEIISVPPAALEVARKLAE